MKFSSIASLYALAGLVAPGQAESPTPVTKATVSDKATLGFATQNGGYVPVFLDRVETGEMNIMTYATTGPRAAPGEQ
jgi:hypothetical protein